MLGLDCDIKGIKDFVLLQMAEPFEVRKPEYMPCRVCRKSNKKGLFVYTSLIPVMGFNSCAKKLLRRSRGSNIVELSTSGQRTL